MSFTEIIMLAAASCFDAMGATVSYRASGIRFPLSAQLVMTFIHGAGMAFALFLAEAVLPFSPDVCIKIGAVVLILLGVFGIVRASLDNKKKKELSQKAGLLGVIFDETAADRDGSRSLSCIEAVPVSLAVATDAFAVGVCVGPSLSFDEKLITAGVTLVVCFVLLTVGLCFAKGIRRVLRERFELSFIQGAFLLLMGVYMLFTK